MQRPDCGGRKYRATISRSSAVAGVQLRHDMRTQQHTRKGVCIRWHFTDQVSCWDCLSLFSLYFRCIKHECIHCSHSTHCTALHPSSLIAVMKICIHFREFLVVNFIYILNTTQFYEFECAIIWKQQFLLYREGGWVFILQINSFSPFSFCFHCSKNEHICCTHCNLFK